MQDLGFAEREPRLVLRRHHRLGVLGPIDPDGGIVPNQAAFVLGGIVVRGFVKHLRRLAQHEEPVRKALGDPELLLVGRRQHVAKIFSKRRRTAAQIDSDIEDLTRDDAHQFSLRPAQLIVQSAQNMSERIGVIVLKEANT
jgi:hypothetical protein